jgi:hypothetical protein
VNKTLPKLTLDILLTVLFILLIYPRETGFTFHEITGLATGALIILHLLLNWSWVKNVTSNLFKPKLKSKTKLFYILNALSLATWSVVIITGIQISTVLFPNHGTVSHDILLLHKWLSYVCLGLFGLHLALHWSFFTQTVPRFFKAPSRPSYGKLALNIGALVLTLGLLVSQIGFKTNDVLRPQTQQNEVTSDTGVNLNRTQIEESTQPPNISLSDPPTADKSLRGKGRHAASASSTITSDKTNTDSSSISSESSNTASLGHITITQYLGNLFCTGCSKHCSLLSPQCSIGVSQAAAAKQEYAAIYGTSSMN